MEGDIFICWFMKYVELIVYWIKEHFTLDHGLIVASRIQDQEVSHFSVDSGEGCDRCDRCVISVRIGGVELHDDVLVVEFKGVTMAVE